MTRSLKLNTKIQMRKNPHPNKLSLKCHHIQENYSICTKVSENSKKIVDKIEKNNILLESRTYHDLNSTLILLKYLIQIQTTILYKCIHKPLATKFSLSRIATVEVVCPASNSNQILYVNISLPSQTPLGHESYFLLKCTNNQSLSWKILS